MKNDLMELKVLLTGRNRRIAMNIAEHLTEDRGYLVVKCPASKEALFQMVPIEMPQVVIICLGDETRETVKVFDVIKETANTDWMDIIVVTNTEDSKVFMEHTGLKKMYFLSRPVSLVALYSKLNEIEEKLEEYLKDGRSMMTEYINPNVEDKPKYKRKHILVVDDDTEQLMLIKEHLAEFYDVTVVKSGASALKYLEKHEVDLMLLDYIMPEMDGPEVFMRIRSSLQFSRLPVVFLTGVTEREKVIKTLVELKPQGYIVKPAKKSDIVAKIIDVLG